MELGIALAPESRRDQGLCLNLPIGLNINLPVFDRLSKGGSSTCADESRMPTADPRSQHQDAEPARAGVGHVRRQPAEDRHRQMAEPRRRLFIFDEPTVGVDVGTKAEIYRLFAKLLKEGAGIILISSYLPEVYELADRLHVFRDRQSSSRAMTSTRRRMKKCSAKRSASEKRNKRERNMTVTPTEIRTAAATPERHEHPVRPDADRLCCSSGCCSASRPTASGRRSTSATCCVRAR
jgi:hypothetical protein